MQDLVYRTPDFRKHWSTKGYFAASCLLTLYEARKQIDRNMFSYKPHVDKDKK